MRFSGRRSVVACCVLVLVVAGAAHAGQDASHKNASVAAKPSALRADPTWRSLTPAQQSALAPLERDWPGIDADRKEKWLEVAANFPKMKPEERQRVQERMAEWARLSPKERGEARLHYQELRQMSAAERQARWEKYRALPPDQRRELAARATPASGASERSSAPAHIAPRPASAPTQKSNLVSAAPLAAAVKPVGPTVVQAKPGATTSLMSKRPSPPPHQQPGLPKVAATPGFVDRKTLLPQKGAQAAGTRPASVASTPARP